jgi:hypothetical protein
MDRTLACGSNQGALAVSSGLTHQVLILLQVLVCGLLQDLVLVIFLSHQIKRLEDSWFKSFFRGDFSSTPTRCLVKCLCGYKLLFDLIFIIDLTRVLAGTDLCLGHTTELATETSRDLVLKSGAKT